MTSKFFGAASFAFAFLTELFLVFTIGRMRIASAFQHGINWKLQLQHSGKLHSRHRVVLACTL